VEGVAVKLNVYGSLRRMIHVAVGFPAHIKRCYVTQQHQIRTCSCAHCDLCIQL